jgi:hypothetical protein
MSNTTQSTSPGNEYLPPGAPDSSTQVHDYPAVTIVDEGEHKAQEDAAAEERIQRAKSVSNPKRLSGQEMLNMAVLLKLLPEGENIPLDTPIPLESVPAEIRDPLFEAGTARNMQNRGLVKLIVNLDTKQIDALRITDIGFDVYQRQSGKLGPTKQKRTVKANGEPRANGGRTTTAFNGLRLKKMADQPRAEDTMGYFSWQLYEDGMTYSEYMARKDYPESRSKRTGELFRGPGRNHWDWDLMHGFIALYRENEPETLEDGSPNPNYWAINNSVKK